MIRLRLTALFMCLTLGVLSAAPAAQVSAPGPGDRCPVCGMLVAPYPAWTSTIVFKDGSQVFFDGPKDMLRYYLSFAEYNRERTLEDVAGLYVTEYYTTELKSAEEVFFVVGSDVMGPMGKEMVPVAGNEAAETFRKDHGGQKILTFAEMAGPETPRGE